MLIAFFFYLACRHICLSLGRLLAYDVFCEGNNVLCAFLVEVHHVKAANLIVWSHLFLVVCHFRQVAGSVIKCLNVWTHFFANCLY